MPYIGNIVQDFSVNNAMLNSDSVTSIKIVDGTIEGADIAANLDLSDSQKIRFGTGNDLQIYHDGSHSYIQDDGTGDLIIQGSQTKIRNTAGHPQIVANNDVVELYYDNSKKFETFSGGISVTGQVNSDGSHMGDNDKAKFGNSDDLEIYHDGSNSLIVDNGTGGLILGVAGTGTSGFYKGTGQEPLALFEPDGPVSLYHNNIKKFETYTDGIKVFGQEGTSAALQLVADDGDDNGDTWELRSNQDDNDLTFKNNISGSSVDKLTLQNDGDLFTTGDVYLKNDSKRLKLGASDDLQIFHDGSDSNITNTTGNLILQGDSILLKNNGSTESYIRMANNGAVELYHDNSKKFETTSAGGTLTGNLTVNGNVSCVNVEPTNNIGPLADNKKILIGNSSDLEIYHDGTHNLMLCNNSLLIKNLANSESMIRATVNGDVEIYHDNVKRIETTANGADFTVASGGQVNIFGLGSDNGLRISGPQSASSACLFFNTNHQNVSGGTDQYTIQCGGANHTLLFKRGDTTGNVVFELDDTEHVRIPQDNKALKIGASQDLQIYHDGSHSRIDNKTGALFLRNNTGTYNGEPIKLQPLSGEDSVLCVPNGRVELHFDNEKQLETSANGVIFRGEIRSASTSSTLSNCTLKNESTSADVTDYLQCRTDNNTARLVIEPDGDVKNQNTSYGGLSDSKLKENIVDANSQWNDIKAIKVRNFNFKESTGFSTHTQIGVVAQELEITSPHLVYESIDRDPNTGKDLGTKTKNVRYSVMYMKAVKCLQEAMAKIEVLETEVAALKAG
tara:strand:+ start:417 stop:2786 length:2370 start_codon:yes stop_codon:yes gene_type:complete